LEHNSTVEGVLTSAYFFFCNVRTIEDKSS
jgi:hypothetical protein